ncbi:MAG: AzlC family ABC transporter permease [Myxococcales bacterium]|nr:MAG: AzlC family ABC transporter permease [Myxococcales bacterium]
MSESEALENPYKAAIKDILPLILGLIPFGLVTGVRAVEIGFSAIESGLLSVFVFAGAAQLAMLELFNAHAPWFVVIGTALVINLRMMMYSASIGQIFSTLSKKRRWLMSYVLTDQAFALSVFRQSRGFSGPMLQKYYLTVAFSLWGLWLAVTVIGALIGAVIPASWGLDFAVPLTFLALLIPGLRTSPQVFTALVAATFTLGLSPILPMKTGLLVGILAGIAAGMWSSSRVPVSEKEAS